jgi:gamma-glutamyl hercynylcysteine S-oxide synthase
MSTYNALDTPRVARGRIKMMDRPQTIQYLAEVRRRVLALLEEVDLASSDPILRDGFVYELVIQHEHQHDETILQTLQLMPGGYLAEAPPLPEPRPAETGGMVAVPAGRYLIGTDGHEPYDNEHPRHEVELPPFAIDRFPVSNGDYMRFMADGGYALRELWSRDGWDWILTFGTEAPEYWRRDGDGWACSRFGLEAPVDPRLPVSNVCWFEADAYARWAGKRLPTEPEWEKAVRVAEIEHAHGAVWQWTSSHFTAYPGFRAFPYPEYSEVFFGNEYRVLRGGAWITDPVVARTTFRNWDYPQRRQIFSGIRLASDA